MWFRRHSKRVPRREVGLGLVPIESASDTSIESHCPNFLLAILDEGCQLGV